ncbi:MAG TPA: F0F1 ATP synthase subunit B [Candidatus Saccharimonadia bacterium]|nr:F0F1 ATP synthase subunit B [Candidatus Saccharimonadia bacterium]
MLATLSVLAAEEAEKTINPVLPVSHELFWGAIAFFGLLIVMWAVCLPPIKKAMRQRDEGIQADREAAEKARVEAEQVRRDYEATLTEARVEANRIVGEAREAADERRTEILTAVENELTATRQAAMAEIDQQRSAALSELTGEVAGIATSAASKVVQRELDAAAQRPIVDSFVAQSIGNR